MLQSLLAVRDGELLRSTTVPDHPLAARSFGRDAQAMNTAHEAPARP